MHWKSENLWFKALEIIICNVIYLYYAVTIYIWNTETGTTKFISSKSVWEINDHNLLSTIAHTLFSICFRPDYSTFSTLQRYSPINFVQNHTTRSVQNSTPPLWLKRVSPHAQIIFNAYMVLQLLCGQVYQPSSSFKVKLPKYLYLFIWFTKKNPQAIPIKIIHCRQTVITPCAKPTFTWRDCRSHKLV